ncbi:classical arabinogalactan protein 7-like [Triticum aestivum]|uniref:classical arabinogalactan protein 7-like n=1 Tax=Triticum aestivum TaxID=4565 RepID=UPI001D013447|nr:classical arabinogalactan protein 7-like [Triticum aestivum]
MRVCSSPPPFALGDLADAQPPRKLPHPTSLLQPARLPPPAVSPCPAVRLFQVPARGCTSALPERRLPAPLSPLAGRLFGGPALAGSPPPNPAAVRIVEE